MYARKRNEKANINSTIRETAGHSVGQHQGNATQLSSFVDNRQKSTFHFNQSLSKTAQFMLQRVVQLEKFDAGSGSVWHIHHEHMKLGTNTDSRVEFNGRSAKAIRKELGEKIDRYGFNVGGAMAASFRACIKYINAHY